MLLDHTIAQLDVGFVPPKTARDMGHLGYMQWLGSVPADRSYLVEARRAYERAKPFRKVSPAVAVFCDLLSASLAAPLSVLDLRLPPRMRRGGAKARRAAF